jgi:hypothetical protein
VKFQQRHFKDKTATAGIDAYRESLDLIGLLSEIPV